MGEWFLVRGTNRQFYCTGVIIYNKTRKLFLFVSAVRQTFLGFKMTSNSRDTSPLRDGIPYLGCLVPFLI